MNERISIILHTIIVFSGILLFILDIYIFKKVEKEIKSRKNYLNHVDELVERHSKHISRLIFYSIVLIVTGFILIAEVIGYCT